MPLNTVDAKIKIKGTSITGETSQIGPSGDHTDGTWSGATMVYDREFFFNTADNKLWIGTNEIPMLVGSGGTSSTLALTLVSGGTGSVLPTFGTNTNSSDLSTIAGGYYNNIGSTTPSVINPADGVITYNVIGGGAGNSISGHTSSIVGGINNSTVGFNNVHIIGSNITATAANVTYVEALMNCDNGTVLRKKVIDTGDWDMDATASLNVAHGLSATEWKTVRVVSAIVRNDADNSYVPVEYATGAGVANGAISQIDATNVILGRTTGGNFDSTSFDSTSYNRGWVTLEYTPDV